MKTAATIFVAVGAFLLYAVIAAVSSAGGARIGVAVAYVGGALMLGFLASKLWRRSSKSPAPNAA